MNKKDLRNKKYLIEIYLCIKCLNLKIMIENSLIKSTTLNTYLKNALEKNLPVL